MELIFLRLLVAKDSTDPCYIPAGAVKNMLPAEFLFQSLAEEWDCLVQNTQGTIFFIFRLCLTHRYNQASNASFRKMPCSPTGINGIPAPVVSLCMAVLDWVSVLQGHGTEKTSQSAIPHGNTDIASPLEFPAAKTQTCYRKPAHKSHSRRLFVCVM